MKIGIDIRTLMDAQYSGVSEYTYHLVKEILRLDKKNSYKLFYNAWHDVSERLPKFPGDNVELTGTKYPNKLLNLALFKCLGWPKVDQLLGGVDVFFMPNINFIALSPKCRSILTVHDLSFTRYPEFFSLRRRIWHQVINAKKLIRNFDHIVAVSENTKNDVIELCGAEPEKVSVIYSGVDSKFRVIHGGDDSLREVRKKYNLPKKFILFLGTLEPRKNVEGVIMAYDMLCERNKDNDYQLVIAGMKGWKAGSIFTTWQASVHKDNIKFLGYVDNRDKVYLYNMASLFVYPSFYEGFGFPPLEAMACGAPVVTSFASSLPEVVGEAAIMVDPYNVEDISRAMEQVLESDELRCRFIARGLERAKMFSWESAAREYLEVFVS